MGLYVSVLLHFGTVVSAVASQNVLLMNQQISHTDLTKTEHGVACFAGQLHWILLHLTNVYVIVSTSVI